MGTDTGRAAERNDPTGEKERRDTAIMGTNTSSIVSKRSVERLYSKPEEPQLLRYFVKKPQRRSPLINRGYWLRTQVVDHVVRSFLFEKLPDPKRKKVVINLGCGYDPLPFRFISSMRDLNNVLYIDLDYPDMITTKSHIVSNTPELHNLLKNPELHDPPVDNVHFRSSQYLAVGCELRELDKLKHILMDGGLIDNAALLFTAEVSLAYIDQGAVDALVAWTATLPDARFSVLEQCMPSGSSHPFARTMLKHFSNLSTPLKSIEAYPTLTDQASRFANGGWKTVDTLDLLAFWSSLVTDFQRKHLESVEPFDEWEEFFVFCQHHFITHARTGGVHQQDPGPFRAEGIKWRGGDYRSHPGLRPSLARARSSKESMAEGGYIGEFTAFPLLRRWMGAAAKWGDNQWVYHGGLGSSKRLGTSLLITGDEQKDPLKRYREDPTLNRRGSGARMCHTLTQLAPEKLLLVGGRASPDAPMSDVWIVKSGHWKKVESLPRGRYRHCAAAVGPEKVLICGGKGDGNVVLDEWFLWNGDQGWKQLTVDAERKPSPRFGASLCWTDRGYGVLSGGMDDKGQVLGDLWRLEIVDDSKLVVTWSFVNLLSTRSLLRRFGAKTTYLGEGRLLIIGGVSGGTLIKAEDEVVEIHCEKLTVKGVDVACREPGEKPPFLIGHQVLPASEGIFCVVGGGGVCFSFGGCFNEGIWTLAPPNVEPPTREWRVFEEGEVLQKKRKMIPPTDPDNKTRATGEGGSLMAGIRRVTIKSQEDFWKVRDAGEPVVIEGLDIGKCVEKWTPSYLKATVGPERWVIVHASQAKSMNFHAKNFSYKNMTFGDFIDAITSESSPETLYLRSLSSTSPKTDPAKLAQDFPSLAEDFTIPPELQFAQDHEHSSPLRISAKEVGVWLHFDVMANLLCHIHGTKRFKVYPPTDITKLSFLPSASSSTIENPFDPELEPDDAHPMETILKPGDVLFIPELWPHAAYPLEPCVAVNVFFKSLEHGYSSGNDVYGNKDLAAYEKGRTMIGRIGKEFERLPSAARRFYMERLADELANMATNE
ncbi:unnamed protein product [Tuber aestivum]|uniref:tRNA wybutosine-synthesizing protein 4 n=1 Tax=Tuber aestivum TaxID=59557 RepID=A0A292Q5P6_9PEZI|nr:unnamed protein product [Tuber aestivum]